MGETLKRGIWGAVFIAVPIFSLLYLPELYLLFVAVSSVIAAFEFNKMQSYSSNAAASGLIIASVVLWAATALFHFNLITDKMLFGFIIASALAVSVRSLFSSAKYPSQDIIKSAFGYIYTQLTFLALYLFGYILSDEFTGELVLFVFILIWTNDTFAYVSGRLFGKNKLCPRLSPGKTWEGTLGGAIFAVSFSYLLSTYVFEFGEPLLIYTGLLVAPAATLGDLFESALKRNAQVKDSGAIIPGHGGILDRFDAALFTFPACTALIYLLY